MPASSGSTACSPSPSPTCERAACCSARDRLGKKPLFHATFNGVLHFASEIKALKASPLWNGAREPRRDRRLPVARVFPRAGHRLSPRRKLEPAPTWLSTARASASASTGTSSVRHRCARRSRALIDDVDARLAARCRSRLESEVPIGAFLSGGIDSGLVVSYMAEALAQLAGRPRPVGFDDAGAQRARAARGVDRRASSDHASHDGDRSAPARRGARRRSCARSTSRSPTPSAIPTYYVSKIARRHVTVALSGDGGDETFGGYDVALRAARARRASARVGARRGQARQAAAWLGARWPRSQALPRPLRLGNVLENLGRDPAAAYYADLCFLKPQDARALLGQAPTSRSRRQPGLRARDAAVSGVSSDQRGADARSTPI